jgi:hypothetical protein
VWQLKEAPQPLQLELTVLLDLLPRLTAADDRTHDQDYDVDEFVPSSATDPRTFKPFKVIDD